MKQARRPASGLPAWLAGAALAALALPASGQGDSWQPQTPLRVARRLLAAATAGGQVYTFGGCGSPCFDPLLHPDTFEETLVEVFDPSSGSWTRRGPMPTILFGAAAAPGNGHLYTFGGFVSGNVVQEYDPQTDAWRLRAPMPTPRYGLAAVAHDGKIYAVGGSGPSPAMEIYDPVANRWTTGAPMPTARVYLAAAALEGRIYAIGGSPDCCGGSETDAVEVYDPASDSWTSAAPLPAAQQLSGAVAVNGKIYAFGGFIPGLGAQGATYEYDPQTDQWSAHSPMPRARDQAGVALVNGRACVFGGSTDCHCQALVDSDCYDPPPRPPADLAITKEGDPGPLCPGERIHYQITARNNGSAAVDSARVRDHFPAELRAVTWTCRHSPGATCHGGGGTLDQRIKLPAGGHVIYTLSATVREDLVIPFAGRRLLNPAEILPPPEVEDPDLDNNRALVRTRLIATTDLAITKIDGVSEVTSGELTTYVITVSNRGSCPVACATVDDPFGPGFAEVAWSCASSAGAGCSTSGVGPIHDDCVKLPVAGAVVYTAQVRVTAGVDCPVSPCLTQLSNTATVSAPGGVCGAVPGVGICDDVAGNNSDTDTNLVRGQAPVPTDLVITKSAAPGSLEILAGEEVAFEIRVTNAGSEAVTGALVRDELPPGLEEADWLCMGEGGGLCSPAGEGGIAESVTLPAGAAVLFRLSARTRADFCGSLLNSASVSPPPGVVDLDPHNNSASAEAVVFRPGPGFFGCKRVEAFSPAEGTVTFVIELLNAGPLDQLDNQGSELVDNLPLSLDLLTAAATSGTVGIIGNSVVWDGAIPAGGTVTLTLTAQLREGFNAASVCNRAKLFIDTDGDGFNDEVFVSDDPDLPGEADPTCIRPDGVLAIPALSPLAAALLVLGLLAAGLARLRSLSA